MNPNQLWVTPQPMAQSRIKVAWLSYTGQQTDSLQGCGHAVLLSLLWETQLLRERRHLGQLLQPSELHLGASLWFLFVIVGSYEDSLKVMYHVQKYRV